MGILNTKQRVVDAIVTEEGRRQIAAGNFKVEHYSFSDASSVYSKLLLSGNVDESVNLLSFEAINLPKDQVCYEADDSGMLMGAPSSEVNLAKGYIFLQSSGSKSLTVASGSQFASLTNSLTQNSLDSFKNLKILMTPDVFDEDVKTFKLSDSQVQFDLSDNNPIRQTDLQTVSIEHTNGFIQDKRLSHIENFHYLPPLNKKKDTDTAPRLLGRYQNLSQPILTMPELLAELNTYRLKGQQKTVKFLETSKENNLFCQLFEINNNTIKKLDIIDYGIHPNPTNQQELVHVLFAGKVFVTENNTYSFIHLFTLLFE